MIAKLPIWLQDLKDAWPMVLSVIGFIVWVGRQFKTKVVQPLAQLMHLVKYHLGPNGETKALHRRVSDIERAHGIEDT